MLTARGWWLLLLALFLAALGTVISVERLASGHEIPRTATLAIIGLTLAAWLLIEAIQFHLGTRGSLPGLRVEREVRDTRGPIVTLWAGRTYDVIVRVSTDWRWPTPFVMVDDRFPF